MITPLIRTLILALLFWNVFVKAQTQTVIIVTPKINKDSLLQLSITRTRPMTRLEIGLGFTHFDLSGVQWQKDMFTSKKDSIPFSSISNPFSFSMGCAFPIKKFNKTTALGMNISLLSAVGRNTSISLPLLFTIKKGGDATLYENHKKVGIGFGLGAQAGLYYFSGTGHNMFGANYIRPAYMVELNFTPKIGLIKLRCIGNIGAHKGTKPYKDQFNVDFYGTYKLKGTVTVLFVITPFWAIQKHLTKAYSMIPFK
jgi:hypothetical protein